MSIGQIPTSPTKLLETCQRDCALDQFQSGSSMSHSGGFRRVWHSVWHIAVLNRRMVHNDMYEDMRCQAQEASIPHKDLATAGCLHIVPVVGSNVNNSSQHIICPTTWCWPSFVWQHVDQCGCLESGVPGSCSIALSYVSYSWLSSVLNSLLAHCHCSRRMIYDVLGG